MLFICLLGLSFQSHTSDSNHEAYIFFLKWDLRLPLIASFHRWGFKKNIKHFKTHNKISRIANILCRWLSCCPHLLLPQTPNSSMSDKTARTHDIHPKLECRNTFCSSGQFHLTIFNSSSILQHLESRKLKVNSNIFFWLKNATKAPNVLLFWKSIL